MQLINDKELEKAEEITDIAMAKMPVDDFGYYTLLEPYISAYYEVKSKEKARQLFKDVAGKYQENLVYLSGLTPENQNNYIEEIYTDIQRYRALVDVVSAYDDNEYALEEIKKFNSYLELFPNLLGPLEEEPVIPEDIDLNSLLNDSVEAINPE